MSWRLIPYMIWLSFICTLVCSPPIHAQSSSSPTEKGTGVNSVVLTRLSPPVYPPIALTARIAGDIDLILGIRRDGGVDSAVAISGPELLYQAALNSAKRTQFKCDNCTEELTQYHLFYSFRIDVPPDACTGANACNTPSLVERPSEVTQIENHITLIAHPSPVCICDYVRKVRSLKCLYLWKCGFG
jgi:Gram-negative bacterial TonB protein C-terminal